MSLETLLLIFQSTHPRGVRHYCHRKDMPIEMISIHAPARGATVFTLVGEVISDHFNPRTREGCDNRCTQKRKGKQYFNPRTREGCDDQSSGAGSTASDFNPRTREGCDQRDIAYWLQRRISIHAPARGATAPRLQGPKRSCISIHAPARGATKTALRRGSRHSISIHAPARGATRLRDAD